MILAKLIQIFNSDLPVMQKHLYTGYRQWESCKLVEKNLCPGEIAPQEDYQQNVWSHCFSFHSLDNFIHR